MNALAWNICPLKRFPVYFNSKSFFLRCNKISFNDNHSRVKLINWKNETKQPYLMMSKNIHSNAVKKEILLPYMKPKKNICDFIFLKVSQ